MERLKEGGGGKECEKNKVSETCGETTQLIQCQWVWCHGGSKYPVVAGNDRCFDKTNDFIRITSILAVAV